VFGDPLAVTMAAGMGAALVAVFALSMSETSFVSCSHVRLRRAADEGDRRARRVLRLLEAEDFLSAIVVAINLCVIAISCLMTLLLRHWEQRGLAVSEESLHLGTVLVILFVGEVTPKTLGAAHAERLALPLSGAVLWLTALLRPPVRAVTSVTGRLLASFGVETARGRWVITQEDLVAAVDVGEEEEVVEPEGAEMFDSALRLFSSEARDLMVPRVDVAALDAQQTVADALDVIQETGFSRLPVYEGTIDHVHHFVYANDLLRCLHEGSCRPEDPVIGCAQEAMLVPETMKATDLFRRMRERKIHFAVAVDEHGGTEGIVTLEDILEELVGDITDEHDVPGEEIRVLSAKEALVSAKARISAVNETLAVELPDDEYETLGGLVAGVAGRIPAAGEAVVYHGLRLTVEEGDEQRLHVLRLVKLDQESGET